MVYDTFPPVILSISMLPNPVLVGGTVALRVTATDSAQVITSEGERVKLRDGKRLTVRRDRVAIEYEMSCTGAELEQAVAQAAESAEALAGLAELLAQVVGVPQ